VPLKYVMCCGNQKQHLCNVKSKHSNIPEILIMEIVLYLGCKSCQNFVKFDLYKIKMNVK
jgi:hypothetical protein